MNVLAPVSTIMTTNLITVNPADTLSVVKEIFDENNIHHLPVVRYKKIVGIISKTDFLYFLRGFNDNAEVAMIEDARLKVYTAEDIMTKGLAKVESTDRILTVIDVLSINRFHAIPIVDNDELVGIVTTHDIIKTLASEGIANKA